MDFLRITEIFLSLQGEARTVGWPTVFVRLTGCPLRCTWCDSAYAFSGGERLTLEEILLRIRSHGARRVCVTGGEPLAQPRVLDLMDRLVAEDFEVSLETSGALDVAGVHPAVSKVLDLKPPGSGEEQRNRYENLALLGPKDQVKFVITNRQDYLWSITQIEKFDLTRRAEVLFSPVTEFLKPATLAEWILADGLDVRFQIQLHKVLWGDRQGV